MARRRRCRCGWGAASGTGWRSSRRGCRRRRCRSGPVRGRSVNRRLSLRWFEPNTCHHLQNGPLAADLRLCGPFFLRPVVCHLGALQGGVLRGPRTFGTLRHCDEVGRDFSEIELTLAARDTGAGLDAFVEQLAPYGKVGIQTVIVLPPPTTILEATKVAVTGPPLTWIPPFQVVGSLGVPPGPTAQ